ncbi:hypothetical protein MTR72_34000 [Bradyrhizobium sp. ISRA442]|uniref:hypothetical protein n=1 Tax=Bradyrhizobium sp. ISRA442 TaxID=2866197 RepID=UPI00311AEF49
MKSNRSKLFSFAFAVSQRTTRRSVRSAACVGGFLLGGLIFINPAAGQPPIPHPPIALGTTSFLDGEGHPGFVLETIGDGYQAWRLNDATGRQVSDSNRQSVGSITLHPIYVSNFQILGGNLGFDAILPLNRIVRPSFNVLS